MNKKNIIIWVVIVIIVGVGGYYLGTKHASAAASAATGTAGRGAYAGRTGGAGFSGVGSTGAAAIGTSGGSAVTGQIVSMDSQSITIALRAGGSQVIFYTPTTTVSKMVTEPVSDLNVGDSIVVSGSANSDGSLTANAIQLRPATTTPVTAQ